MLFLPIESYITNLEQIEQLEQLNRNAKGMDRKNAGYELIQLDDFKDTTGTTDGSEVVLALYYTYREKIAVCEGYTIQSILKKRFRLTLILNIY